ncbi:transcription factor bHLH30-like isoform X2 [Durio zibethinus]|uniref:Transcription factor bHLH30-like isoform X2 n=1 Tax=Durio zibethinus TaxID=66656 RepID=A0A6P5YL64_DURZI|nr:transcription factor bHLH30-like isoform X2 [Durio zibethinus]
MELPQLHSQTRCQGKTRNGSFSSSSSSSLVLDSERGELVEATMNLPRKGVSADRNVAALKNHSEAERRRRARINAHFDTLRDLVPGANKMDKASLLAEVIGHLRELKKNAEEACEGILIPMDTDEVRVEKEDEMDGNPCLIRATLCCDYKPGLLSDLRQALDARHLMIAKAEMATWEGRMKNVFLVASCKEGDSKDAAVRISTSTVDQTLRSVLDKFSASEEFSLRATLSNKRRRVSLFNSSLSSSSA